MLQDAQQFRMAHTLQFCQLGQSPDPYLATDNEFGDLEAELTSLVKVLDSLHLFSSVFSEFSLWTLVFYHFS